MNSSKINFRLPTVIATLFFLYTTATIFKLGLSGYSIAETLMNYKFGFYRRALIGNFLVWIENPFYISVLIKIIYCACLGALFLIVFWKTRSWKSVYSLIFLSILFFSPFGVFFYLKNLDALRKELLFIAVFCCFLCFKNSSDLIKIFSASIVIVICGLIHENFFFIFLPFFLSYLLLNDILSPKYLAIVSIFSLFILLCLTYLVPGNSIEITKKYVNQFANIGFNPKQFDVFDRYQSMTMIENISTSITHFKDVRTFIYNLLYFAQFALFFFLSKIYKIRIDLVKPVLLIFSLVFIWFGVLMLSIIAMDLGRWLAMAFCCSLILILSQVKYISSDLRRQLNSYEYLLFFLLIILELYIYIPYWTLGSSEIQVWTWVAMGDQISALYHITRESYLQFSSPTP